MDTRTTNKDRLNKMNQSHQSRYFATSSPKLEKTTSRGKLRFANLANGLYLHSSDHLVTEPASNTVELEPGMSFNILLEGSLDFSVGAKRYKFTATPQAPILFCSILSNKDVFSRFLTPGQKVKKVNVAVSKDWLFSRICCEEDRAWLKQVFSNSQIFTLPHDKEITAIAESILELCENTNMSRALASETFGTKMFMQCLQILQTNFVSLQPAGPHFSCQKTATGCQIVEYIENNLDSKLSVQAIASDLGLSPATLQRRFRQRHQESVSQYLKTRRLQRAKSELLIQNLSIGEVAFNAGYNHVSNFNHAFRKHFNVSPARYIKQHFDEG